MASSGKKNQHGFPMIRGIEPPGARTSSSAFPAFDVKLWLVVNRIAPGYVINARRMVWQNEKSTSP